MVFKGDASGLSEALVSVASELRESLVLKVGGWAISAGQVDCLKVVLEKCWAEGPEDASVGVEAQALLGFLIEKSCEKTKCPDGTLWDRDGLLSVLMSKGININQSIGQSSPLCLAVQNDDLKLTSLLLDAGAEKTGCYKSHNTDGVGYHRYPAFCLASSVSMVGLLLDKGVPYIHASPSGGVGGIGELLMNWKIEDEVPLLVSVWLNSGGNVDEILEASYGPGVSLSDYVFNSALELNQEAYRPAQEARHKHRLGRLFLIQESLVMAGLPLSTKTPGGRQWGQLVDEKGSRRLKIQMRLGASEHVCRGVVRARM